MYVPNQFQSFVSVAMAKLTHVRPCPTANRSFIGTKVSMFVQLFIRSVWHPLAVYTKSLIRPLLIPLIIRSYDLVYAFEIVLRTRNHNDRSWKGRSIVLQSIRRIEQRHREPIVNGKTESNCEFIVRASMCASSIENCPTLCCTHERWEEFEIKSFIVIKFPANRRVSYVLSRSPIFPSHLHTGIDPVNQALNELFPYEFVTSLLLYDHPFHSIPLSPRLAWGFDCREIWSMSNVDKQGIDSGLDISAVLLQCSSCIDVHMQYVHV